MIVSVLFAIAAIFLAPSEAETVQGSFGTAGSTASTKTYFVTLGAPQTVDGRCLQQVTVVGNQVEDNFVAPCSTVSTVVADNNLVVGNSLYSNAPGTLVILVDGKCVKRTYSTSDNKVSIKATDLMTDQDCAAVQRLMKEEIAKAVQKTSAQPTLTNNPLELIAHGFADAIKNLTHNVADAISGRKGDSSWGDVVQDIAHTVNGAFNEMADAINDRLGDDSENDSLYTATISLPFVQDGKCFKNVAVSGNGVEDEIRVSCSMESNIITTNNQLVVGKDIYSKDYGTLIYHTNNRCVKKTYQDLVAVSTTILTSKECADVKKTMRDIRQQQDAENWGKWANGVASLWG